MEAHISCFLPPFLLMELAGDKIVPKSTSHKAYAVVLMGVKIHVSKGKFYLRLTIVFNTIMLHFARLTHTFDLRLRRSCR